MKAIKIDFTIEFIEVPDHVKECRFASNPPPPVATDEALFVGLYDLPNTVYTVEKVYTPTGESKCYLVRDGDKEFIQGLFAVSANRLNRLIKRRAKVLFEQAKRGLELSTERKFRALPWWKRLFNTPLPKTK